MTECQKIIPHVLCQGSLHHHLPNHPMEQKQQKLEHSFKTCYRCYMEIVQQSTTLELINFRF